MGVVYAAPHAGTAAAVKLIRSEYAADALSLIHRAGIIHRDLKPGNVILSPNGPKALDFGIVRALDETAITVTHVFVGSSGWASPDQYRGIEIGPASDVYGWGRSPRRRDGSAATGNWLRGGHSPPGPAGR
ncbi:MAG: protein kinase domain-containing protein, partial [Actinoallomurus sp.]